MGNNIKQNIELKQIINACALPFIMILLMFILQIFDNVFQTSFNNYGLIPRKAIGLIGIITSPFLHANYSHLFSNLFPFFFLLSLLFFSYNKIALIVFTQIYIWTGILVWISARDGNHIGASGLIYGLSAFLVLSGLLRKDIKAMALAFLVIFLYGSLIWGIFPNLFPEKNISWESHLWGLITGFILAFYYRKSGVIISDLNNEDDEDEDIQEEEYWNTENTSNENSNIKVNYYYPNGLK